MTESDFRYALMRLGYTPDKNIAKALRRMVFHGDPLGPAGRMFDVRSHFLAAAYLRLRELQARFTVTADELEHWGLALDADVANALLAKMREQEAPIPKVEATVTAESLRASGCPEPLIERILNAS